MKFHEIEASFRSSPLIQELAAVFESGDYSRFESDAKRQHFVPQFLLRNFAPKRDGKDVVTQLNVESGEAVEVDLSLAASRRYFYAFLDEEGNRNNMIEGFLSRVESHASDALRRLLADPQAHTGTERATLSFFFALQDTRTPIAATRGAAAMDTMMRLMLAEEFNDDEAFAASYAELFGEASPETIAAFQEDVLRRLKDGSVELADPEAAALQAGLAIATRLAYVVFAMDWRLLTRADAFVTSDRGLAMYDPEPPYPFSPQAWRSSKAAETTIPLSSDACLLIRPLSPGMDVQEIDEEGARVLNLRTYGWADGYIFGKNQTVVEDVRSAALKDPDSVDRPRPRHQLMLLDADPDDTTLGDANEERGWPRHIEHDGVNHDYVVIPYGENPLEVSAAIDAKVEERARRKLGIPEGEMLRGRVVIDPVDPETLR